MILSIKERIVLAGILPERTSFTKHIIAEDIRKKVIVTQEEVAEINLHDAEPGPGVVWDKEIEKEVEFTKLELDLINEQFRKIDVEQSATKDMIDVYLKFKAI
jgi:hypothetical protein